MSLSLQSTTDDENRMIVAASNDRTQGTRYLYDRATDKLTEAGRRHAVAARSEDGGDEADQSTRRATDSRSTAT